MGFAQGGFSRMAQTPRTCCQGLGDSRGKEPEVWPAGIQVDPRGLPTNLGTQVGFCAAVVGRGGGTPFSELWEQVAPWGACGGNSPECLPGRFCWRSSSSENRGAHLPGARLVQTSVRPSEAHAPQETRTWKATVEP